MNQEKKDLLAEFTAKAEQRLRDKLQIKQQKLTVPSMAMDITIRNLQKSEILEVLGFDDDYESIRYAAYLGVMEPCLKDVAVELKNSGQIRKYTDVVDIFEWHEINEIATEVMKLSGVNADKTMKVKAVEDLKN